MVTADGLREVARYADGVGVDTRRIVPAGPTDASRAHHLIRDAHRAGLNVHTWTIRDENSQLPADFRLGDTADPAYPRATGDVTTWITRLASLGVDGLFADNPGTARAARPAPATAARTTDMAGTRVTRMANRRLGG